MVKGMKRKTFKRWIALILVLALLLENPILVHVNTQRNIPDSLLQLTSLFDRFSTDTEDGFHFSLYYQLNGGTNSPRNPRQYDITQLPFSLQIPQKEGYDFAGWYTDSDYEHKIVELNHDNCSSYVLYAKWTPSIHAEDTVKNYEYTSKLGSTTRTLKSCKYRFLDEIKIPGMPSTREEDLIRGRISGENQCPQGLCMTRDYILVTAYCVQGGKIGSLHIFDRKTGEYLVTLGMKESSHLGGVAYDGKNVWICHSDNQTLERIDYEYIRMMAGLKPRKCIDCTDYITAYKVENRPSCVTCYDGHIWVATQTAFFKSLMFSYVYKDDELVADACYEIPDKVQGVAFDEKGRVYLSTSLGRRRSSYIKEYDSLEKLDTEPGRPQKKIEMPPCSEEIELVDNKLYVLFESAGLKYLVGTDGTGESSSPIDKILEIKINWLKKK